jgi:catechol 2,3-dioxygenase-like lactoylglutathione lyase family enzyme
MDKMNRNKLALTDVIVELHVPDFEIVRDFYGKLGFSEVWSHPPKGESGYLVMKRDKSILAFYCGNEEVYNHKFFKKFSRNTVRGYGVEIGIHIVDKNIEDYYKEVVSKLDEKYIVSELESKPWGTKDFRLVDPFGYYLSIRENDKVLVP